VAIVWPCPLAVDAYAAAGRDLGFPRQDCPACAGAIGSMSLRPRVHGCARGWRFRLILGSRCTLTRLSFQALQTGSGALCASIPTGMVGPVPKLIVPPSEIGAESQGRRCSSSRRSLRARARPRLPTRSRCALTGKSPTSTGRGGRPQRRSLPRPVLRPRRRLRRRWPGVGLRPWGPADARRAAHWQRPQIKTGHTTGTPMQREAVFLATHRPVRGHRV
jgi:hypothetical protein